MKGSQRHRALLLALLPIWLASASVGVAQTRTPERCQQIEEIAALAERSDQMVVAAQELRDRMAEEQSVAQARVSECLTGARTEDCDDVYDGTAEGALRERENQIGRMDAVIARLRTEGIQLANLLAELEALVEGVDCGG